MPKLAVNLGAYPLGTLLTITDSFTNPAGASVDPAQIKGEFTSPATRTVTTVTYPATINRSSTGVYTFTIDCNESGIWTGVSYGPRLIFGQSAIDWYFTIDDSPYPISGR